MKDDTQKNILSLVLAGMVLIMANVAIFMITRNGQIAPVDNLVLWGAFAVLNVCSLLWAVSLLGLQPMVVAVSYTAGGFIAFQGVRLISGVNVAEIATAGATYSAFGALVVGNATTKVRLAFFTKRQIPFVFIIIALLLVDSLLNSRVSSAGWNVIANAVVFPFLFSGVVVGLAWVVITQIRAKRALIEKAVEPVEEENLATNIATVDDEEVAQLQFSVPESAVSAESMEGAVLAHDPAPVADVVPEAPAVEAVSPEMDSVEEDNFFPLEIDKGEEALLQEENPDLMGVAARVAESAPEPTVEPDPVIEDTISPAEESPVSDPEPIEDEAEKPVLEESKAESEDWLSSHLDLLNKLK
jgi:hypothetical protein